MIEPDLTLLSQPRRRRRSGMMVFAAVYTVYFAFGSINIVPIRGTVPIATFWLALAGLVAYFAGWGFREVLKAEDRNIFGSLDRDLAEPGGSNRIVVFGSIVGAIAMLAIVVQFRGLPILLGEGRLAVSGYSALLIYGAVLAIIVFASERLNAGRFGIFAFAGTVLGGSALLLMGFRTVLLVVVGAVFFFGWLTGRYRINIRTGIGAATLLWGLSWLAAYRFGAGKVAYLAEFQRLGLNPKYEAIVPIWATPREGVSVFNLLLNGIPAQRDFAHGEVFLSSFASVLPGSQLGPRLLVAQAIGGRPGVTITPSILGEPYMDFGLLGVFGFMFVVGFVLRSLFLWQAKALTWAPVVTYSFVLTSLLLDIHSGYLDVSIMASTVFLILWASSSEASARRGNAVVVVARQGLGKAAVRS